MANTIQKLLSIDEVAGIFSLSKVTIYRMIESRKIPFYKINGSVRFCMGDILKYIDENRIEPLKMQYERKKNK